MGGCQNRNKEEEVVRHPTRNTGTLGPKHRPNLPVTLPCPTPHQDPKQGYVDPERPKNAQTQNPRQTPNPNPKRQAGGRNGIIAKKL